VKKQSANRGQLAAGRYYLRQHPSVRADIGSEERYKFDIIFFRSSSDIDINTSFGMNIRDIEVPKSLTLLQYMKSDPKTVFMINFGGSGLVSPGTTSKAVKIVILSPPVIQVLTFLYL